MERLFLLAIRLEESATGYWRIRMQDDQLVAFLQWALPHMDLLWPGYRKVRRQVSKRIARRIRALELADLEAYRQYLETHAQEWRVLDGFCRITISRFYRDRRVFDLIGQEVLPELAGLVKDRGEKQLRCWSAGCGAGEEPYSLVLTWTFRGAPAVSDIGLSITATDVDPAQIARAWSACYSPNSLKELPTGWRDRAFNLQNGKYCLRPEYRSQVDFVVQDIRETTPSGPFHLILCRNLAFTYFAEETQREIIRRLDASLIPGGMLVIGSHESLPEIESVFSPCRPLFRLYRKRL